MVSFDRAGCLPDHVELAVGLDLADEHRLVQMVFSSILLTMPDGALRSAAIWQSPSVCR
jgi:hypothetical protein